MNKSAVAAAVVATLLSVVHVTAASGQGWSADISAGRIVYDPLSADIGTSTMTGGVQYDWPRDLWVYGLGALPVNTGGTFWGAVGAGGRLLHSPPAGRRARLGVDLSVDGFLFRDRVVASSGTGGTVEALPFLRVAGGAGSVEGYGGWRGHTISFAGIREKRGVFETGVRGGYGTALRVRGDARWVHAAEGTFPFVGGTASYEGSHGDLWAHVGKWIATDLSDRAWGVGAGVRFGARTTVWGSLRRDPPDPLYWNPSRRTWSIGLRQRLGPVAASPLPVLRSSPGTVAIRLRVSDAPPGTVSIAGDFTSWQPRPMTREGAEWVVRLPLAAGVYHYAFRAADGEWFVPASTPGRRDDGLGGHVALLVVS